MLCKKLFSNKKLNTSFMTPAKPKTSGIERRCVLMLFSKNKTKNILKIERHDRLTSKLLSKG